MERKRKVRNTCLIQLSTTSISRPALTVCPSSSTDDSFLPNEILFEILLKLPVKTLLKMMCVSKSWLSLISSPLFIKTHFNISAQNPEFTHHRLLTINKEIFYSYSLYQTMYQQSFDFGKSFFDASYIILGSCDGLFLISKSVNDIDFLFLWNPSIRKLKELPSSGKLVYTSSCSSYGFGYSECQNDYKIIEIVGNTTNILCYQITDVSVYSLRSDSWRRIREYPSVASFTEPGTFVKGRVHWIPGRGVREAVWFNVDDEKFGNVALPDPIGDTFNWKLVPSAGNLCMTCDYKTKTDVWIMKEHGLAESWTKVVSIPNFVNRPVRTIFIAQNDEMLLQDVSGLVMWWHVSRDGDTFKRPENHAHTNERLENQTSWSKNTELNVYVESLVSPTPWLK